MELNLLHTVVKRNLKVSQVFTHKATECTLPLHVAINILEVIIAVILAQNISFPLRVKR